MEKLTENMIHFAESKLGSAEYAGWCLACTRTRCGAECRNEERLYSMIACVQAKTVRSTGDIAA